MKNNKNLKRAINYSTFKKNYSRKERLRIIEELRVSSQTFLDNGLKAVE